MSQRIPKGGFPVSAFTISNNQALNANLSDSGQTCNFLNIINKLTVAAKEGFKAFRQISAPSSEGSTEVCLVMKSSGT